MSKGTTQESNEERRTSAAESQVVPSSGQGLASSAPSASNATQRPIVGVTPRLDIFENSEEVIVMGEFPGVAEDDFELHVDRQHLVLVGRRQGSDATLRYVRKLEIADTVDPARAGASLDAGILKIVLPKRAEFRPRRIPVQSAH